MALTKLGITRFPNYIALSSDISASKIAGASIVGATVYLTDSQEWKIILPDLTLADFLFPAPQV